MADFYIDFNRGNDGNSGTSSASPWKNIAKITDLTAGQLPAGSTVYLRNDSVWDIVENNIPWKQVVLNGFTSGTPASPLTITSYGGTGRPRINYSMLPQSAHWAWDVALSAWYFELSWNYWGRGRIGVVVNGQYAANVGEYIKFNPSTYINSTIGHNGITADTLRYLIPSDYPQRMYLAGGGLTSASNPTDYFGAGKVVIYSGGAFFLNADAGQLNISGLELTGGGLFVSTLAGTRTIRLSMTDNYVHDCGGIFMLNGLHGTDSLVDLDISGNTVERAASSSIAIMGTATGEIHHNHFSWGNMCDSAGGFVYTQISRSTAATPYDYFKVHHNYAEYAINGVGERRFDGCCYYSDTVDNGTVFSHNIAAHSFKAYQTNNGKKAVFHSNIAYDCGKFISATDADLNGQSDYTIVNNLWVSSASPSTYRCGDQEGDAQGNAIAHFTSTGQPVTNINFANNQFVATSSAWSGHRPVLAYQDSVYSGGKPAWLNVQNNSFVGLDQRTVCDMTGTGPARGTDRSALFPNANIGGSGAVGMVNGLPAYLADSKLFGAGVAQSISGMTDFNGHAFYSKPSVGPFEAVALAEI